MRTPGNRINQTKNQAVPNLMRPKDKGTQSIPSFANRRPEATTQDQMQVMANASPQVQQTTLLQQSTSQNVVQRTIIQAESGLMTSVDALHSKARPDGDKKTLFEEIMANPAVVITFKEGATNLKETVDKQELDRLFATKISKDISGDLSETLVHHLVADPDLLYQFLKAKTPGLIKDLEEESATTIESKEDLGGILGGRVQFLIQQGIKQELAPLLGGPIGGGFGFLLSTFNFIPPDILAAYFVNALANLGVFDPADLKEPPKPTDFRRLLEEIISNSAQYDGKWNATGPHYQTTSGPGREWEVKPASNPWETDGVLHTHVDKHPGPTAITKAHIKPRRLKFAAGFARYNVPPAKCVSMGITP